MVSAYICTTSATLFYQKVLSIAAIFCFISDREALWRAECFYKEFIYIFLCCNCMILILLSLCSSLILNKNESAFFAFHLVISLFFIEILLFLPSQRGRNWWSKYLLFIPLLSLCLSCSQSPNKFWPEWTHDFVSIAKNLVANLSVSSFVECHFHINH